MSRMRTLAASVMVAGALSTTIAAEPLEREPLLPKAKTLVAKSSLDAVAKSLDKHVGRLLNNPRYGTMHAEGFLWEQFGNPTMNAAREDANYVLRHELDRQTRALPRYAGGAVVRELFRAAGALDAVQQFTDRVRKFTTYTHEFPNGQITLQPAFRSGLPGARIGYSITPTHDKNHGFNVQATLDPDRNDRALVFQYVKAW